MDKVQLGMIAGVALLVGSLGIVGFGGPRRQVEENLPTLDQNMEEGWAQRVRIPVLDGDNSLPSQGLKKRHPQSRRPSKRQIHLLFDPVTEGMQRLDFRKVLENRFPGFSFPSSRLKVEEGRQRLYRGANSILISSWSLRHRDRKRGIRENKLGYVAAVIAAGKDGGLPPRIGRNQIYDFLIGAPALAASGPMPPAVPLQIQAYNAPWFAAGLLKGRFFPAATSSRVPLRLNSIDQALKGKGYSLIPLSRKNRGFLYSMVDGVLPTRDNLVLERYPLKVALYLAYNEKAHNSVSLMRVLAWMTSKEGKKAFSDWLIY
jgi:hypothetical protein